MKIIKIIIALIVTVILILGAINFFKKDVYIGFYYPDANNLLNDIESPNTFESLELCRDWIDEQSSIYNPNGSNYDDYECGKNCGLQNGQKPYICEETLE
jgi:hypothetical protein